MKLTLLTLLLFALPVFAAPPSRPPQPAAPPGAAAPDPEQQFDAAERDLISALERFRQMSWARGAMGFGEGPRLGVAVSRTPAGLRVDSVEPASPAEQVDLRTGDVLTSIDGRSLAVAHPGRLLVDRLHAHSGGDRVRVEWLRNGQPMNGEVTLESAPAALSTSTTLYETRNGRPWLEVELARLNPQLGEYFGVSHGVLVLSSKSGSLGLRGGDVLINVGGQAVETPSQALQLLGRYGAGDKVSVQVQRNGELQTLTREVPVS